MNIKVITPWHNPLQLRALATAYTKDYFTYVKDLAGGLPPDVSDIISLLA